MFKLNKILFPTDFSNCANQALSHALYLTRKYGAELHMLHGIVLHQDNPHDLGYHFPDADEIHKRLKEIAAQQMDTSIKSHQADHLSIIQVQERDIAAAPAILNYAGKNDIDLIVMGTHGRRGLEHLFLGSVAEEVVRFAPSHVLTIREQKEARPIEIMKNILVPMDFSEYSEQTLIYAKEIATLYGARLQLLHVVEQTIHPAFYGTGKTSLFDFNPYVADKSEEVMKQLIKKTKGPEVPFEIHVIEGYAARDILSFANQNNTDLIMIATHGLTGIKHLLLGSIAEKVVRTAPTPVFTVKAFGKSLV